MIGSACVTFEVAEILRSLDIEVTEVMRENYFWEPALSEGEAGIVERHLTEHGVKIIRNTEVAEVQGVPIGTVMSRLARARVQIKTYLDGERPALRRIK